MYLLRLDSGLRRVDAAKSDLTPGLVLAGVGVGQLIGSSDCGQTSGLEETSEGLNISSA